MQTFCQQFQACRFGPFHQAAKPWWFHQYLDPAIGTICGLSVAGGLKGILTVQSGDRQGCTPIPTYPVMRKSPINKPYISL